MMPNFIIIGAPKAGTTSLYHYLRQHPQIYMSPIKEPNFFAFEGQSVRFQGPGDHLVTNRFSITKREIYQMLFDGVTDEIAVGECSTCYLSSSIAPYRIRQYLPNVKLIAVLRNPVERAYSSFLRMRFVKREPIAEFGQALKEEGERLSRNWEPIWGYRQLGFYGSQLRRYFGLFDRDNVRILLYDEFCSSPHSFLRGIFRFLQVDEAFIPDMSVKYNKSDASKERVAPIAIDSETRANLVRSYEEDIRSLEDLIQCDLSSWLEC